MAAATGIESQTSAKIEVLPAATRESDWLGAFHKPLYNAGLIDTHFAGHMIGLMRRRRRGAAPADIHDNRDQTSPDSVGG
jgi:hypothetical protein